MDLKLVPALGQEHHRISLKGVNPEIKEMPKKNDGTTLDIHRSLLDGGPHWPKLKQVSVKRLNNIPHRIKWESIHMH